MPPNYSGRNLCGRSFRGDNLEEADFSNADIRSADFTGANLKGADFTGAKAGLQKRWAIFLVCFSWLLSGFLEFFLASLSARMKDFQFNNSDKLEKHILNPVNNYFFDPVADKYIFGLAAFIILVSGLILLFIFRLKINSDEFNFSLYILFPISGLWCIIIAANPYVTTAIIAYNKAIPPKPTDPIIIPFIIPFIITFIIAFIATIVAIPGAIAVVAAFNIPFAIAYATTVAGSIVTAFFFFFVFSFFAAILKAFVTAASLTGVIPGAVVGVVIGLIFGTVISWEIINRREEFSLIRDIAFTYASFGGTSFRKADLTDANFTKATLQSTDFRNATLIRVCFRKTKKLDHGCFDSIYLQNSQVRQVLVEGKGQDMNFNGQILHGVNFKDANLINSSFIDADLSDANLQNADLSGANLKYAILNRINLSDANLSQATLEEVKFDNAIINGVNFSYANLRSLNLNKINLSNTNLFGANLSRIQALETNFTKATFTGACIENWNTNSTTNLTDVICDYIYLREGQQERRPNDINENYATGEFTQLFQKAQETVDLIFRNGINWQAFLTSFQKIKGESDDNKPSIQSIENKDDGAFIVRINVPSDVNKAEFEKSFKHEYDSEEKYRIQLQAQDEKIAIYREKSADIMEMAKLIAKSNIQNNIIEIKANSEATSENKSVSEFYKSKYDQKNANNQFVDTAQSGSNVTFNQHNYTPEQKQKLAEAAAEIQQLLYQLSKTNPTTDEAITEAIHLEIKGNPTLKARLQSALKAGGLEALKAIFNHPLFSIPAETVKGWLEAE